MSRMGNARVALISSPLAAFDNESDDLPTKVEENKAAYIFFIFLFEKLNSPIKRKIEEIKNVADLS